MTDAPDTEALMDLLQRVRSIATGWGSQGRSADDDFRRIVRLDLMGAVLMGADLPGVPKIENIHQAVYAAASAPGALKMSDWHTCETTHCRAGWVTTLAGKEGRALDDKIGTAAAAVLIYLASDPTMDKVPNFYGSNADALEDMRALAKAEAGRKGA